MINNLKKTVIGMIHVQALPGTPRSRYSIDDITKIALAEAKCLEEAGFDGIIVENMHDIPYLKGHVGPEITAAMTTVVSKLSQALSIPVGVQVLAGCNEEACAVALAGGGNFIRAENFAYAHVADEGLMPDASAGPLLRFRRKIAADHIMVFADVKKKHAAHSITQDLPIQEVAKGCEFFGAEGVIVTGTATGEAVNVEDLRAVKRAVKIPVFVGSGVTATTISSLWKEADGFIIGSFLKVDGKWASAMDIARVSKVMQVVQELRGALGGTN